jgi:hypothetical protein
MGPVAIARRAQLSSPLPQTGDVRLEILKREMHVPDSAASNVRQIRQIRSHRIGLGAQDLPAWIIVTGD